MSRSAAKTKKSQKKGPGLTARLNPFVRRDAAARGRGGRETRLIDRRWMKPALAGGAGLCALAAVVGASAWSVQSGALARWSQAVLDAGVETTREAGLALEAVYVTGRKETDRNAILEALDVEIGAPILTLDPDVLRAKLEGLGWVAAARVERRLPDALIVRLEERSAAAIWQRDGELVLIDRAGAVIGAQDVPRFGHLKVLVGEGAPQHAARLLDILDAEPAMKARVRAAVWMGERRWNLRFDNGVDVRLPEDDPQAAWARLARLERDHEILARAVAAIDLRQPDRLIVRMTRDGALQINARRSGEET
ncbi:MAG: FtsQ-type POTRA domain-containing protein [Marivibrio sp.]|uniref:cell division protein FtsQ/DivIB n=1 Tax=Marivibrio sp. TaxID=2039719 RepID=UPI0032EE4434